MTRVQHCLAAWAACELVAVLLLSEVDLHAQTLNKLSPSLGAGFEVTWYAGQLEYTFVGPRVMLRLAAGASPALEATVLYEINGDDVVTLIGGLMLLEMSASGGERLVAGGGFGWLRWTDSRGWDRGTWNRVYQRLVLGIELPLGTLFSRGLTLWASWSWLSSPHLVLIAVGLASPF